MKIDGDVCIRHAQYKSCQSLIEVAAEWPCKFRGNEMRLGIIMDDFL